MDKILDRADAMVASDGRLLVLSLTSGANAEMLDAVMSAWLPHGKRFGEDTRFLALVTPSAKLPDDATRERIKQIYKMDLLPGKTALVIEGEGFWAAAMRGIVAGLSMISKRAAHSVRSIGEGLSYLGLDPSETKKLESQIEALRSEHRDHVKAGH